MTPEIFLAAPVRTAIGKFGGSLVDVKAPDLAAHAVRESLRRAALDPVQVDTLILGHARQAASGPNPARQVAKLAGLPFAKPAYTVNQACASGLRAIVNAASEILLGESEVVVAAGVESMSNTPYFLPRARWGYKLGSAEVVDGMYRDGFICPLCGQLMGETAENLAAQYAIGRDEQDAYAVETQARCEQARKAGRFAAEIVPIEFKVGKETRVLSEDEHPRDGVTLASLTGLKPVFRKDGTVHAGNSSGITDGAAALLVLSGAAAARLHITPMARLVAWTQAGVDPAVMGIGPVPAMRKLYDKTGLKPDDFDLIELNEAFAAQVLACDRELHFDRERLNVNGGAIALGHPIGATGARIVVTLLHELARRGAHRGVATLCVSGGMGMALAVERV